MRPLRPIVVSITSRASRSPICVTIFASSAARVFGARLPSGGSIALGTRRVSPGRYRTPFALRGRPLDDEFRNRTRFCWAVAKLVRHQALDLAFEGSNPSRPAIMRRRIWAAELPPMRNDTTAG